MTQPTRRTWTKWRRLIREQERSGQSVSEFCRERELHASYFFAWRKRLRESATARFLEVQVAEPGRMPQATRVWNSDCRMAGA
jgi:transposase-like protein